MSSAPAILLIDDNRDDAELTREALSEAAPHVGMTWAADGLEAMGLLRDGLRPDVILLDLNMPRMDGRETLRQIKADPDLAPLPVIILSTSDADRDVIETYRSRATAFMVKPVIIDDLIEALRDMTRFWLGHHVRLPPKND